MTKDSTIEPPTEATDPTLSSAAKDEFFANKPESSVPNQVVTETPPTEPPRRSYDVKARNSTIEDADFNAQETNVKGGDEVE